jgi:hypothetical protein
MDWQFVTARRHSQVSLPMLSALRRIFNSKHTFQMIAPISAATCRRVMLFALASLFAGISGAAEPKVFDGMIRIPGRYFCHGP